MIGKKSYTKEELIACGHGQLFGEGNAQLPTGNMLMFDRITTVNSDGGAKGKGIINIPTSNSGINRIFIT